MVRTVLASFVFVFSMVVAGYCADLGGSYQVSGTNPGNAGTYQGDVSIAKKGDVYAVNWKIGDTKYVGTGLLNNQSFAVVYKDKGTSGLALYAIQPDGSLSGFYAGHGDTQVGKETWTPKK